jgi:hypothetical protein
MKRSRTDTEAHDAPTGAPGGDQPAVENGAGPASLGPTASNPWLVIS